MSAAQAPSADEMIQQLFNHAVVAMAEGASKQTVIKDFVNEGVPREAATAIVSKASQYKKQEFRKAGMKTLAIGIGFLVLGAVITAATYSAASGGGTYVVTTGLFLVGGLNLLRGLFRLALG